MERVELNTYDGVTLSADLYLPEGGREWAPGIVVCHGFGSSKASHTAFGELAAERGFAALIPDLRGHGQSGGEVDGNIFNDVAASLLFLQNRPEVNPTRISIRGSSMGGWLAIHTAAHLQDLSPVIALCPTNELFMTNMVDEAGILQRGHPSPRMDEITKTPPRVNVNSAMQLIYRLDLVKAGRRIAPRPLLLVHCEDDELVPTHISERVYSHASEPRALWLLPGGDHSFAQHDRDTNIRILDWILEQQL